MVERNPRFHWFCLAFSVTGHLRNSRHSLNQSEAKLKPLPLGRSRSRQCDCFNSDFQLVLIFFSPLSWLAVVITYSCFGGLLCIINMESRGEKALQDICWNAIHFNIHLCSFLAFEFFVLQFYDIVVNNSSKGFMKKPVTGCPPSLIRPLTAVCLACKPALMFGFSFTVPSKGD